MLNTILIVGVLVIGVAYMLRRKSRLKTEE